MASNLFSNLPSLGGGINLSPGFFSINIYFFAFVAAFSGLIVMIFLYKDLRSFRIINSFLEVKKSGGLKKLLLIHDGLGNLMPLAATIGVDYLKTEPQKGIKYGSYENDPEAFMNLSTVQCAIASTQIHVTINPDMAVMMDYSLEQGLDMDKLIALPDVVEVAQCFNKVKIDIPSKDNKGVDIDYSKLTAEEKLSVITNFSALDDEQKKKWTYESSNTICGYSWELPATQTQSRLDTLRYEIKNIGKQIKRQKISTAEKALVCPHCKKLKRAISEGGDPQIVKKEKRLIEIPNSRFIKLDRIRDWTQRYRSSEVSDMLVDLAVINEKSKGLDNEGPKITAKMVGMVGLFFIFAVLAYNMYMQGRTQNCIDLFNGFKQAGGTAAASVGM